MNLVTNKIQVRIIIKSFQFVKYSKTDSKECKRYNWDVGPGSHFLFAGQTQNYDQSLLSKCGNHQKS